MSRKRLATTSFLMLAVLYAGQVGAQVRAVYDSGAGAVLRQLERLQTTASVLHIGAHPDDEDSALVAYHARGEHARTATCRSPADRVARTSSAPSSLTCWA